MKMSNKKLDGYSIFKDEEVPILLRKKISDNDELDRNDESEIILEQYGRRYHPDLDFD